jgi:hypothetical protein
VGQFEWSRPHEADVSEQSNLVHTAAFDGYRYPPDTFRSTARCGSLSDVAPFAGNHFNCFRLLRSSVIFHGTGKAHNADRRPRSLAKRR